MPAALTHNFFARDVYSLLPREYRREVTNMPLFYIGAQGPDFLLYHHAMILPGSLSKISGLLHRKKVPEVMAFWENECGDPDIRSYFIGYLCHYALDSEAHPLIIATAKAEVSEGDPEGVIHSRKESEIDLWMLRQRRVGLNQDKVWKAFEPSLSSLRKLSRRYARMFKEVFGLEFSAYQMFSCFRDMHLYLSMLRPNSRKFSVVYQLENKLKQPHGVTALMIEPRKDSGALNLSHEQLPHPFHSGTYITASFPQLYVKAEQKAVDLITQKKTDYSLNFLGE